MTKMDWSKLIKILSNEPEFRKKQVHRLLFHELINDWDKATNLSLSLREKLKKEFPLEIKYKLFKSKDKKTIKGLIELEDGLFIETVLMIHGNRTTVCVSTQVGCPLGCLFCATGKMGLIRNLNYYEICEQVLLFKRMRNITNVVFMGMGEPFLNYDNTIKAIKLLNDSNGFNIGARKISVSTSGIIPGIEKFMEEDLQVNLSISLHAPNNELRSKIMPINDKYPLNKVMKKVYEYIKKTNRKVMLEYLMIKGVNDSIENAEELYELIKGKPLYMINLIKYNPTGKYSSSTSKTIKEFKDYLEKRKIFTTQRFEFGKDIEGACGQLIVKS
ncbi:MAG: 23S rRNA (adenine(2503)-C(2))-methyltransferase RlmN [Candidatus Microsyncoccus archaeolyticus]|nr:MAG: 23S rRNA (adenine(2503)-C(2))-methyltransferase RlmN [Candidatus Parcubacteria bacterium]